MIYDSRSHLLKVESQRANSKDEVQKEKYRDEHDLQIRRQVPDAPNSAVDTGTRTDFISSNHRRLML